MHRFEEKDMPINFQELSTEQRQQMFDERIATELYVDSPTLGFDNIEQDAPTININDFFELPPLNLDSESYGRAIVHAAQNDEGRWIRTMLRAYQSGARIFYKKHNDDIFLVRIVF